MSTTISFRRDPLRKRLLSEAVLVLDLVLWLFCVPLMLRVHSIPKLLERLARSPKYKSHPPMKLTEAVRIVTRVCNLRAFRSSFFPKQCLRQSLSLYRTLNQLGYSVEIHFGVLKGDKNFRAHSWVTLDGEPVADTAANEIFKPVYSYSSVSRSCYLPSRERSTSESI